MIKRLRKKFIRIAMISVAVVLVVLSVIVNAANFLSTDSDLKEMLDIISENRGIIPTHGTFSPNKKDDTPTKKFRRKNPEAFQSLLIRKRRIPPDTSVCGSTLTEIYTTPTSNI